jgi:hypothetical protein
MVLFSYLASANAISHASVFSEALTARTGANWTGNQTTTVSSCLENIVQGTEEKGDRERPENKSQSRDFAEDA